MQLAKEGGITVDELAIDQAAQTIARRNEVSMEEMLRRLAAEGSRASSSAWSCAASSRCSACASARWTPACA
jgi:hypothetical protein